MLSQTQLTFTCSTCGKVITTTDRRQLTNNVLGHLGTHKRTETLDGELTEKVIALDKR